MTTRVKMQSHLESLQVDQLWMILDDFGLSVEGVFKINTHYFFFVLVTCHSCVATSRVATTRCKMQSRLQSLKVDQLWMTLDDFGSSVEGVFKINTVAQLAHILTTVGLYIEADIDIEMI